MKRKEKKKEKIRISTSSPAAGTSLPDQVDVEDQRYVPATADP